MIELDVEGYVAEYHKVEWKDISRPEICTVQNCEVREEKWDSFSLDLTHT